MNRQLAAMLLRRKGALALGLGCYLIGSLCTITIGQELRAIVDSGFGMLSGASSARPIESAGELRRHLLQGLGLVLTWRACAFIAPLCLASAVVRTSADIRQAVFASVTSASAGFLETTQPAEVQNRLIGDILRVESTGLMLLSLVSSNLPLAIGGTVMMLATRWDWALALIIAMALMLGLVTLLSRNIQLQSSRVCSRLADVGTSIAECIRNIRVVKIDGQLERHGQVLRNLQADLVADSLELTLSEQRVSLASGLGGSAIVLAIAAWGWMSVAHGAAAPGELFSFGFYAVASAQALTALTAVTISMREGRGSLARLMELLGAEPASAVAVPAPVQRNLAPVRSKAPRLRAHELSFRYPSAGHSAALQGVSFELLPGSWTALIGRSGAGKSTLLDLIVRWLEPDSGYLETDGVDIRRLNLAEWRQSVGIVQQDVSLFHASVRDNIRYARPQSTDAEVVAAAEAACAAEFIERLPAGYDTMLGATTRLSGGEKQRLAIARAVLKDPPLLLLDEATAALDTDTEARVQKALRRLMTGRTVLFATHRHANLIQMDSVLVLEQGRLTAHGPHETLVKTDASYADLMRQSLHGASTSSA